MNTREAKSITRAMRPHDTAITVVTRRRATSGASVAPLRRGPLAKLAWIFGVSR